MQQHPLDLRVEAFDAFWQQAFQLQRAALGLGEAGEFVLMRVAQEVGAAQSGRHEEFSLSVRYASPAFCTTAGGRMVMKRRWSRF